MVKFEDSAGDAPGIDPPEQSGAPEESAAGCRRPLTEERRAVRGMPPPRPEAPAADRADGKLVDAAKVSEIKRAIAEGRFKVNVDVVADRLIESVFDPMCSNKA